MTHFCTVEQGKKHGRKVEEKKNGWTKWPKLLTGGIINPLFSGLT